jgi:hypothetical protein
MNHPITLGGLLAFLLTAGGVIAFVVGILMFLGGAMSDAPEEGDADGKRGCIVALVGVAMFVVGLWGMFA